MRGIYKFQNKINNKIYIGQSIQLEERYKQHKRNYQNINDSEYQYSFHSALRKYGFDNFDYEILISNNTFTKEELNELEIFYINKYNSYYCGYNETKGGNTKSFHKLEEKQIFEIKNLLCNSSILMTEIVKKYDISLSLLSQINSGKVWSSIGEYKYPIREKQKYSHQGENNSNSLSSDKEILEIRKRFVNESLNDIYEDYKDKYSFSGLKKIVYGVTNTHLPIYKKRQKCWFLNGTCIDYPRLEE